MGGFLWWLLHRGYSKFFHTLLMDLARIFHIDRDDEIAKAHGVRQTNIVTPGCMCRALPKSQCESNAISSLPSPGFAVDECEISRLVFYHQQPVLQKVAWLGHLSIPVLLRFHRSGRTTNYLILVMVWNANDGGIKFLFGPKWQHPGGAATWVNGNNGMVGLNPMATIIMGVGNGKILLQILGRCTTKIFDLRFVPQVLNK